MSMCDTTKREGTEGSREGNARATTTHKTKPNVLEDRRSSPRTPVASTGSSCRKRQAVTRPPDLQCGAEKSQAVAELRRPMLARRHCCARSSGRRSAQSQLALLSRTAAWPQGNLAEARWLRELQALEAASDGLVLASRPFRLKQIPRPLASRRQLAGFKKCLGHVNL